MRLDRRLYALISTSVLPTYLVFGNKAAQMLDWLQADRVRMVAVREILIESTIDAEVAGAVLRACADMTLLRSFVVRGGWGGTFPLALPPSVIRIGISRLRKAFANPNEIVMPARRIRHLRLPRSSIDWRPPTPPSRMFFLTFLEFTISSHAIPTIANALGAANRLRRLGLVVRTLGDAVALFRACKTRGGLPKLSQLSLKCKRCVDAAVAGQLWVELPDALSIIRLLITGHGAAGAAVLSSIAPVLVPDPRAAMVGLTAIYSNIRPEGCTHCISAHDAAAAQMDALARPKGVVVTTTRFS